MGRMRGEGRAGAVLRGLLSGGGAGFGLRRGRRVCGRGGPSGLGQENQRLEPGESPQLGDLAAELHLRGPGSRPG